MLDVRNAIANILDRHSLADIVDVTLRKMRRDGTLDEFWIGKLQRRIKA